MTPPDTAAVPETSRASELWALVIELERANWQRKWGAVRRARKALEAALGPRPHTGPFDDREEGA